MDTVIDQFLSVAQDGSWVTDIAITGWGTEVVVSCIFDPGGNPRSFQLAFHECKGLTWDVLSPEKARESVANVIGLQSASRGEPGHGLVVTDIFELSIWYGELEIIKDWELWEL